MREKGFTPIIIILLVLIISALVYITIKPSFRLPLINKPLSISTLTLSPTPASSAFNSNLTKRYESERIIFDYPADWVLETSPTLTLQSPNNDYFIDLGYVDFTDYKEDIKLNPNESNCSEFILDNKRARRCLDKSNAELRVAATFYDSVVIEQIIGIYSITGTSTNMETLEKYKPVLNDLINSVKFKNFSTRGCGGVDSQGELLCKCSGNYTRVSLPIGGLPNQQPPLIGSYQCSGTCKECCYSGSVQQNEFSSCN